MKLDEVQTEKDEAPFPVILERESNAIQSARRGEAV